MDITELPKNLQLLKKIPIVFTNSFNININFSNDCTEVYNYTLVSKYTYQPKIYSEGWELLPGRVYFISTTFWDTGFTCSVDTIENGKKCSYIDFSQEQDLQTAIYHVVAKIKKQADKDIKCSLHCVNCHSTGDKVKLKIPDYDNYYINVKKVRCVHQKNCNRRALKFRRANKLKGVSN